MAYLVDLANKQDTPLFMQFGGQGTTFLREMRFLYGTYAETRPFFHQAFNVLREGLAYLRPIPDVLPYGFNLESWVREEEDPPSSYLGMCTVALAGVHIVQSAYYQLLIYRGYDPDALLSVVGGMTGHSMGFHSAHLAALGLTGDAYNEALRKFILFVLIGGYRCQQVFPIRALSSELEAEAKSMDQGQLSPMVGVLGLSRQEMLGDILAFNSELPAERWLTLALQNSPLSCVVSGCQEEILAFRRRHYQAYQKRGVKWTYLEVSAPFHCHLLRGAWLRFDQDNKFIDFNFSGSSVKVPVYSTETGQNIQELGPLYEYSFKLMTATPLDWQACLKSLWAGPFTGRKRTILDFGPGRFTPGFTRRVLEDRQVDLDIQTVTQKSTLKTWLDG